MARPKQISGKRSSSNELRPTCLTSSSSKGLSQRRLKISFIWGHLILVATPLVSASAERRRKPFNRHRHARQVPGTFILTGAILNQPPNSQWSQIPVCSVSMDWK